MNFTVLQIIQLILTIFLLRLLFDAFSVLFFFAKTLKIHHITSVFTIIAEMLIGYFKQLIDNEISGDENNAL
jgi:F0F1-type ATP synthase membrane subunit a